MTREIIVRRPGTFSLRVRVELRGRRRRAAIRAMRRRGYPLPAIAFRLQVELRTVERALDWLAVSRPRTPLMQLHAGGRR